MSGSILGFKVNIYEDKHKIWENVCIFIYLYIHFSKRSILEIKLQKQKKNLG